MFELRILKWGDYPRVSRRIQRNHRVLIRRKQEVRAREGGNVMMSEEKVGRMYIEDGGRGHEPRNKDDQMTTRC